MRCRQITILLVVDLLSSLAYIMMTQPLPIAGKLPIKTLVAKQVPTMIHVFHESHVLLGYDSLDLQNLLTERHTLSSSTLPSLLHTHIHVHLHVHVGNIIILLLTCPRL